VAKKRRRKLDAYRKLYQSEAFSDWWEAYPRKVSKMDAYDAWENAVDAIAEVKGISKKYAAQWLQERTLMFAKSYDGKSKEFCPYPSSWLNGARFDDDPDEWQDKKITEFDVKSWRP